MLIITIIITLDLNITILFIKESLNTIIIQDVQKIQYYFLHFFTLEKYLRN